MRGSEFAEFKAFAAVAEHGSFVRASKQLGYTASAMSQTIRVLEGRLGVRLLHRTTRRVSLTDAGTRLLARLQPAFQELDAAGNEIEELKREPSGTLRIVTPRIAYVDHVQPVLAAFHEICSQVTLDITISDSITDIVALGYDLGIRLGELLEQEVVALRLGDPIRQLAVASPTYLAKCGIPTRPEDLHHHNCINWRQDGSPLFYHWEFEKDGQHLAIAVKGTLTLNDRELAVAAAAQGLGIAFWAEHRLKLFLSTGKLVPMLEDWSPTFPGFFAYYRKQRFMPRSLKLLLDTLKGKRRSRLHPANHGEIWKSS